MRSDAVASMARALDAEPHASDDRFVRLQTRMPAIDLEQLSAALPDEPMVFWAAGGEITLGLGAALRITGRGDTRFTTLREGATELPAWAELFCGFAFTAGHGGPFGDAVAVLPRFSFRTIGGETTLSVVHDRRRRNGEAEVHDQLAILSDAMARAPEPKVITRVAEEAPQEAAQFLALVETARTQIRAGAFDKVVVHRQTRLPAGNLSAARALDALAESQPTSTRYAFRLERRTFLGATPERLVRRTGDKLRADVLAGSLPRDTGDLRPSALLESAKDRGEHELTRAAIADVLRPLCTRYEEDGPHVQTLPHLYHLHTAVEGELAMPTHVLDLVAALHPTPAVGGAPRAEALAFIAETEQVERGWYAAPIGWFRPDGDGDFSVALRCALMEASSVTLYAGAGIVADSDPARELAETASKRRAIAQALGVEFL